MSEEENVIDYISVVEISGVMYESDSLAQYRLLVLTATLNKALR